MSDWRNRTLPDGRVVEFLSAVGLTAQDDDPPGTLRVGVTVMLDGVITTMPVLLTSAQVEAAFAETSP